MIVGNLLPFADDGEGIKLGLHNHGEEQERPGYTLQELIQLSRSSVLQQRLISLETLSNILRNVCLLSISYLLIEECTLKSNNFFSKIH